MKRKCNGPDVLIASTPVLLEKAEGDLEQTILQVTTMTAPKRHAHQPLNSAIYALLTTSSYRISKICQSMVTQLPW